MRRKELIQSACGIGLAVLALLGSPSVQAQSEIRLSLNEKTPTYTVAGDYTGFSYEMQDVIPDDKGVYYFRPDNKPLVQMFRTLGIRTLRVGGNTADRPSVKFPDEKDLDSLFAFAKAADVRVIFTMRLKEGDPKRSAAIAKYIMDHYRAQLLCFAIGNEPNVFTSEYATYVDAFKKYVDTIRIDEPQASFCGPGSTGGRTDWARNFASEFNNRGYAVFITYHYYPGGNSQLIADPADGRRRMLSAKWLEDYATMAQNLAVPVLRQNFNYRLEEVNSYWNGGRKDASDTQASALWGLEYLHWWALHGCGGVNFHTGEYVAKEGENTRCYYASFWTTPGGYAAHPLAYGIKAFDLVRHGQIVPVEIAANRQNLNLSAYGMLGADKSLYITVINKECDDGARTASVRLGTAGKYPIGKVMWLTSPKNDVAATSGVTLGGEAIREDGTWNGTWTPLPPPADNGEFRLDVPPATAAVVRLAGD